MTHKCPGESFSSRLKRWIIEQGEDHWEYINEDFIKCKDCNAYISAYKVSLLKQHLQSKKHLNKIHKFPRTSVTCHLSQSDYGHSEEVSQEVDFPQTPPMHDASENEHGRSVEEIHEVNIQEHCRNYILGPPVGMQKPCTIILPEKILSLGKRLDTGEWIYWVKHYNLDEPRMLSCTFVFDNAPQLIIAFCEGMQLCMKDLFELNHDEVPQGFQRGLNPEKIVGDTNINGTLYFLMTWEDSNEYDLVTHAEVTLRCPYVADTYKNSVKTQPSPRFDVHILGDGKRVFGMDVKAGEILGISSIPGAEMFLMKWKHSMGKDIVLASEAKLRCPHAVALFYSRNLRTKS